MKLLSRMSDYAVRALCFIAKKDGLASAAEITLKLKVPGPFTRRILQILEKKGYLASVKGKGGGFRLNRPAKKIALKGVIEAFHGPMLLNECLFKKKLCPDRRTCLLRKKLGSIEEEVVRKLGKVTISSLI